MGAQLDVGNQRPFRGNRISAPALPPGTNIRQRKRHFRLEHFQEKWNPVLRPKTRQAQNAGADHDL
jgi:hypothetical protein